MSISAFGTQSLGRLPLAVSAIMIRYIMRLYILCSESIVESLRSCGKVRNLRSFPATRNIVRVLSSESEGRSPLIPNAPSNPRFDSLSPSR